MLYMNTILNGLIMNESMGATLLTSPCAEEYSFRSSTEYLTTLYSHLIKSIGEDPDREGLQRTPQRAARSLAELTQGYELSIADLVNDAIFQDPYNDMVIVRNVEYYSLCEHHLLPFFGKAHVAYIPAGKIIGLSKIPRLVDMFAKRLQVQERLTRQIGLALEEVLLPEGTAVVLEGAHMCMLMRGVQKQGATMMTSHFTGRFLTDRKTRDDFINLLRDR